MRVFCYYSWSLSLAHSLTTEIPKCIPSCLCKANVNNRDKLWQGSRKGYHTAWLIVVYSWDTMQTIIISVQLSSIKCLSVTAYWYFIGSWSKDYFVVRNWTMISVDGLIATSFCLRCLNWFILWTCTAVSAQWYLAWCYHTWFLFFIHTIFLFSPCLSIWLSCRCTVVMIITKRYISKTEEQHCQFYHWPFRILFFASLDYSFPPHVDEGSHSH